jgi:Holliday junction resolvase RusA-like endonuclease
MLKPTAPLFVDVKPDLDNLIKAAQDALNGVGFWTDDAQVACVMVTKRYVGPEQKSGCLIMIAPLEDRATQDPYEKQIQTALEVHAV